MSTEILGYFSETDFCLISADETVDFVPETLFFLVSSICRTLSALAILDLPFPLQFR